MEQQSFTLSILVNNKFGVLTRVTGLFSKRGYNIERMTVKTLRETDLAHIMLTTKADGYTKEQIIKQLNKLYDVQSMLVMAAEAEALAASSVQRQLQMTH